jgi:hypothetical protein
MTGLLEALYREQQASNAKVTKRAKSDVNEAQERRKALPEKTRSDSKGSAPRPNLDARIEFIARPTAISQQKRSVVDKDRSILTGLREPGQDLEPWEKALTVEDSDEHKKRWDCFHHRASLSQQKRKSFFRRHAEKEARA